MNRNETESGPRFVNGKGIAALAGVSSAAVTQAIAKHKGPDGLYDLQNPEVSAYIEGQRRGPKEQRGDRPTTALDMDFAEFLDDPDRAATGFRDPAARAQVVHAVEKLLHTRARRVAVETANARERGDLIPAELVALWFSAFQVSLRDNLLSAPDRVARGNDALRARVASELSRGIDAALKAAAVEMRDRLPQLAKQLRDAKPSAATIAARLDRGPRGPRTDRAPAKKKGPRAKSGRATDAARRRAKA